MVTSASNQLEENYKKKEDKVHGRNKITSKKEQTKSSVKYVNLYLYQCI